MEASFALLFARQQRSAPADEPSLPPPGLTPIEPAAAQQHLGLLADVEQRILGQSFQEAERTRRTPVGAVTIAVGPGAGLMATTHLVTHTAGVAVFEALVTGVLISVVLARLSQA